VFPFNLPLDLGKEESNIFLKVKNVRRHEILEAFTTADQATVIANGTGALPYLDLSPVEAGAILGATLGNNPFTFWGFATGTDAFTIPRPDKPLLNVTGTWLDLLPLVPVFLHRSGLAYPELLDLLDTAFVQSPVPAPGLYIIGAADSDALLECNVNEFQIAHLDDTAAGPPALARMSLFIRLWRRLGWRMRDLDTYLTALEAGQPPKSLVQLFQVKRLVDELKLPPRAAFAFWSDLETRRTVRNPKSLFDETFLVGTPDQPELSDLKKIAEGQPVPWSATSGGALRAHVRAALRINQQDMDLL
jgi:hypothetical protein